MDSNNASEHLLNWISYVSQKYNDKRIHHVFWSMMPAKDGLSKNAVKFIDNLELDFNQDNCDPLKGKDLVQITFLGEDKSEAKILSMRYSFKKYCE